MHKPFMNSEVAAKDAWPLRPFAARGFGATMAVAESVKTTASRLDRAEESPGSIEQGAR